MHLPVPSSLLGVVVMLVVFGGAGLTYILRRKRRSPAGEPTDLAALGFLPGEGVRSHGIGKILFIDERDMLGNPAANMFECGGTTLVTSRVTSSDRLLVEVNGQRMWFDATARPVIRRIGRIMQQDTTGVLDILANQTETTMWFIRDGKQSPPGAAPKKQYNAQSVMEDVYVLELIAPCRPALRFEAVESVVIALSQWAQAPVKATMQIPVMAPMHVPTSMLTPMHAPMLAAPPYIPQQQQAQQQAPHAKHGQTLQMIPVQRAPSQPPQHAAPVAYGHHSSHPPQYAAAPMHGHHSSHPPQHAAPVAQQVHPAPGHHSSHPPHYAASVAPASQARHSVAPSPHAVIRRRSQPSQAAQAMPTSGSAPIAPIAPIVPQLASYVPPQPASYAPPATPRARTVPPPLPQYYVQRYQPTLQSPQFAPGSY